MSEKIYVVVEQDFQYDDQNYYAPEGEPSYPRKAFRTERKAQDYALKESVALIRGRGFGEYVYSGNQMSEHFGHPWDEVLEFCEKHGFRTEVHDWGKGSEVWNIIVDDQPEALVTQLIQWFNVKFYSVEEMTIGG